MAETPRPPAPVSGQPNAQPGSQSSINVRWLISVGIGCGVLLLVGSCVLAAVGVFLYTGERLSDPEATDIMTPAVAVATPLPTLMPSPVPSPTPAPEPGAQSPPETGALDPFSDALARIDGRAGLIDDSYTFFLDEFVR